MTPNTKKMIGGGVAVALVIAATAAIASYATREAIAPESKPVTHQAAVQRAPSGAHYAAAQPAAGQPACDDKNIVGTGLGAVAGGVLGNQVGGGKGRTVATVGGALGGAYLGNQYLPTRNATCR